MSSRIVAMSTATALVILTFLGCGGDQPEFNPGTKYSPSSLAREFSFRYKSLDRSIPEPTVPDGVKTTSGEMKKTGTAKAEQSKTLGALLDEVITKAAMIPGLSHADACKKIAEEIAKDATISDADKKIVADKLGKVIDA